MSAEKLTQSPESARQSAEHDSNHEKYSDKLEKERNLKAEKQPNESIEQITSRVEAIATDTKELRHENNTEHRKHPILVNKELKEMAYSRTMVRVRKRLSAPSRAFSRAVHSKALDKPSELIGSTVARPSSMLSGAIFTFIGTSLLLWITRKYGYEYNYLAIMFLFVGGAVIGVTAESVFKLVRRKR